MSMAVQCSRRGMGIHLRNLADSPTSESGDLASKVKGITTKEKVYNIYTLFEYAPVSLYNCKVEYIDSQN